MPEQFDVKSDQAKILKELEKMVDKPIPIVDYIDMYNIGVVIKCENVVDLGLYQYGLETLPESIGQLKSLKKLNLDHNKLSTLPESIGNLTSLQNLNLSYNQLSTLPESLGQLLSLKTLDLGFNKFWKLPDSITQLRSLETLDLYRNPLLTFPEVIIKLKSLTKLNLGNIQLKTLPESLGSLKFLTYLRLSDNQLTTLPESIGQLSSLAILDLGFNKFYKLPDSIPQLRSLETLILFDNKLTSLPESIGQLKSLETLDLDHNQLTTLPESFWRLKNLKYLSLKNNNWEDKWKGIENEIVPKVLELSRQKASISIFINCSQNDRNQQFINILMDYLKNCREIRGVYNSGEKNRSEVQLFFFVATKNSINDEQCLQELKSAVSSDIPIIPIKETDIKWSQLNQVDLGVDFNLSDQKGFEYDEKNLNQFCEELYKYILQLKREINLFEPEERNIDEQRRNFKTICERFFESEEFKANFRENIEQYRKTEEDLKNKCISPGEYILQWGQILSSKSKE